MNRYTKLALALCLLPAVTWAQDGGQKAPAAPVIVEQAQRDTFSATLWVSGTVISQNPVPEVMVRVGQKVDLWIAGGGAR